MSIAKGKTGPEGCISTVRKSAFPRMQICHGPQGCISIATVCKGAFPRMHSWPARSINLLTQWSGRVAQKSNPLFIPDRAKALHTLVPLLRKVWSAAPADSPQGSPKVPARYYVLFDCSDPSVRAAKMPYLLAYRCKIRWGWKGKQMRCMDKIRSFKESSVKRGCGPNFILL